MKKIISACGNDCASCPRYVAHPYEKTEEQLRHTAELWLKIGYRNRLASNEEIACTGCKPDNWCRYGVVECCTDRKIENCGQCPDYPCAIISSCFSRTRDFLSACQSACTAQEFEQIKAAFFEKEKNLKPIT